MKDRSWQTQNPGYCHPLTRTVMEWVLFSVSVGSLQSKTSVMGSDSLIISMPFYSSLFLVSLLSLVLESASR